MPTKKSVFADHLVCLDCGKHFSTLKRHLMTDHELTVAQYRQKWALSSSYPVVSSDYAKSSLQAIKEELVGLYELSPDDRAALERSAEDVRLDSFASEGRVCEVPGRYRHA